MLKSNICPKWDIYIPLNLFVIERSQYLTMILKWDTIFLLPLTIIAIEYNYLIFYEENI